MFSLSLGSASQHGAHPGEQFRKCEWLDQIIVCAELESFHTVAHTVAGGKKENRCANPIAAEFRNHSQPSLYGSMISTIRRSNFFARACSKPVSPSRARSTAKPASRSPLDRKAAVFFSSSITRIRIAESATSYESPALFLMRRGHSNHQPGKEKCDRR